MYEGGRSAVIAKEMRSYNLEILGLSETRWNEAGKIRLNTHETIIYSGHADKNANHTRGVAIMMTQKAERSLVGWEPIDERLILAKFSTSQKRITLTVIMCYAPTNDAEEDEKEVFYDKLQNIINTRTEKEIILMMGDFNAKVGNDNTGYEEIMGKHGVGVMNENGIHLANFCAENNLVIGGTIFPHKDVHKTTWTSPDQTTNNQIDHICINRKFRRSLLDVRVKRGADAATDHKLVVGKIQLKLKRYGNNNARAKYNVDKLKDNKEKIKYQNTLSEKFQHLNMESDGSLDGNWAKIKEAYITSLETCVGKKKTSNKPWISQSTMDTIEERKNINNKLLNARTRSETTRLQNDYKQKHTEVKKKVKEDRKMFIEDLATQAETAAETRNMRDVYNITRLLSGKRSAPEKPIKDVNGNTLTSADEQKSRWREHFEQLLNRPRSETTAQIPPADQDIPLTLEPPNKEEIRKAIKSLNNGKCGGPDGIPAEAMKYALETTVNTFHQLFKKIWLEENIPEEWKEGYLIKLPKKGDLSECKNYRGIMLLSTPGKVFNKVILERMKASVDKLLRDHQAGFRKDRSCTDQIATLRIIIEQSLEWNSPLYVNFIDFEKAFDSVDRTSLWNIMRHYGIPEKYVKIVSNTHQGMTACKVLHGGDETEKFPVETGVRQGCVLSPFLFLLAIDWTMKETTKNRRNGIQWTLLDQLDDLDFADDLALLSQKLQHMQEKTSILEETAAKIGLKINKEKTKIMRINTTNTDPIKLRNEDLEEVEEFTYLGSKVNTTGGTDNDIKIRICKARTAFNLLKKVWNTRQISRNTKIKIFNSNVKAVLLYGSETWRTTVALERTIQSFINRCLRRILKIHWPDRISNQDLWKVTNQLPPPMQIKKRKWTWIGHQLRKDPGNITRQALRWNPQGKRKRGRPRNSWRRSVEDEMKAAGYSWQSMTQHAQNRVRWRKIVSGLYSAKE